MTAIDRIDLFAEDKDDLHVIIDTPRGSRNKLKWDRELGVLKLSHVLTAGAVFPFDFGFVPGTFGQTVMPLTSSCLLMSHCFRYVWFRGGSSG
jgi:inorganic pyrophosphatase